MSVLRDDTSERQRFGRWFTVWPSTHANAGQTVEVMPVAEHDARLRAETDALREAAQAVVDLIDAEAAECVEEGGSEMCPTCVEQKGWADRLRAVLADTTTGSGENDG